MANDVWEKRTEPPEDWNKPLPPALAKSMEENSILMAYQENGGELPSESVWEMRLAKVSNLMPNTACCIL